MKIVLLSLVFASSTLAFVYNAPAHHAQSLRKVELEAKKGFAQKKVREKSATRIERERAEAAYEEAKASGIPEYRIHLRPVGTEAWLPAGCVTVPRSESVSLAIFANLEPLKNAAGQAYPVIKNAIADGSQLEYGYNLAIFPDDPVRTADPQEAQQSNNPFTKWVKDLTSPMNTN